jgi:hypothetical protein
MEVNPVSGAPRAEKKHRTGPVEKSRSGAAPAARADTAELSGTVTTGGAGANSLALSAIREKVSRGFYNSDYVMQDVTDKLAKLFDRL